MFYRPRLNVVLPDLFLLSTPGSKKPPSSSIGGSRPTLRRPLVTPAGRPILLCVRLNVDAAEEGILEEARIVTFASGGEKWGIDLTV